MNDGADLAFVIPLWRRTSNIERVTDAIRLTTPGARIVFVVSDGDAAAIEAATRFLGHDLLERIDSGDHGHDGWVTAAIVPGKGGERGDYARKINAGYRASDEPFIFTGADDLVPHPGWYDAARARMTGSVGVVGTVDMCNNRTKIGTHSTHSLVARWYADHGACVDQDHVIYHEQYWHEFCDDELVRTAMARGAYAHAEDAVVEHVHMLRDRSLDDDVYRHGRSHSGESRMLFRRRCALWGDRRAKPVRQYRRSDR